MWTEVENPASQTGGILEFRGLRKLLERYPKTIVEELLLAHLQIIVASF